VQLTCDPSAGLTPSSEPAALIRRPSTVRAALRAAACLLLASGLTPPAHADPSPASNWQLDATGLVYSERRRTSVVEPVGRLTRLFQDGQTLSAQLAIDAITGASPTGALPSGQVQTVTSASGTTSIHAADQVPTHKFSDLRGAADLEWGRPIGALFNATSGLHVSREKDYQSVGVNETFSLDVLHRLATVTIGGGVNHDQVFPVGGIPVPLADGTQSLPDRRSPKRVTTGMVGLSRVLSRRWLAGINFTRTLERGYLTEPYKVISLIDPATGDPLGQLTEARPASRDRKAVLASSVYHLTDNILYLEYRYYWDDWGLRSHTIDASYRIEVPGGPHVVPHIRLYTQTAADFYQPALDQAAPRPTFASADYRLGPLNSVTLGGTYGFQLPGSPGEWSVRAEYIRQWGRGPHPGGDEGTGDDGQVTASPRLVETIPGLDIGSVVVSYSFRF
jgi:hypothetical protein